MDEIQKAQYKNLRDTFKNILIIPILGKDYYNTAMDVYTCDVFTAIALQSKFNKLKNKLMITRTILILMIILNFILFIYLFIHKW